MSSSMGMAPSLVAEPSGSHQLLEVTVVAMGTVMSLTLLLAVLLMCATRRDRSVGAAPTTGMPALTRVITPRTVSSVDQNAQSPTRSSPAVSAALTAGLMEPPRTLTPRREYAALVAATDSMASEPRTPTASVRIRRGPRSMTRTMKPLREAYRLSDEGIIVQHLLRQRPDSTVYFGARSQLFFLAYSHWQSLPQHLAAAL